MNTAEKLRDLRVKLCMNQSDFAKAISVNRSVVSFYESGRAKPSFATIKKIIEVARKHKIKVNPEDIRNE